MYRLVQFLSVCGAIMLFTSYWLMGWVLLLLAGVILFKNSDEKGNLNEGFKPDIEKERQAYMKRKNAGLPKHKFLAYNNDILYEEVGTREDFHKMLTDVSLVHINVIGETLYFNEVRNLFFSLIFNKSFVF